MKLINVDFKYSKGPISDIYLLEFEKNAVLDIGCNLGNHLFPFVDLGFKKLVGIDVDKSLRYHVFGQFLYDRNNQERLALCEGKTRFNGTKVNLVNGNYRESALINCFPEQFELYKTRFEFVFDPIDGNIENFNLEPEYYNIILAINVLHFLPPHKCDEILKKIALAMPKGGILYLVVNTLRMLNQPKEKLNDIIIYENDKGNIACAHKNEPHKKWFLFHEDRIKEIKGMFAETLKHDDYGGLATILILRK